MRCSVRGREEGVVEALWRFGIGSEGSCAGAEERVAAANVAENLGAGIASGVFLARIRPFPELEGIFGGGVPYAVCGAHLLPTWQLSSALQ